MNNKLLIALTVVALLVITLVVYLVGGFDAMFARLGQDCYPVLKGSEFNALPYMRF